MKTKKGASDKATFALINDEIDQLIKRLTTQDVCPCCIGTGLMHRGAWLSTHAVGSRETLITCEEIVDMLCEADERLTPGDDAVQH